METDDRPAEQKTETGSTPTAPCPQCGFPMMAVRGSKQAVCSNCGFKDSCCF